MHCPTKRGNSNLKLILKSINISVLPNDNCETFIKVLLGSIWSGLVNWSTSYQYSNTTFKICCFMIEGKCNVEGFIIGLSSIWGFSNPCQVSARIANVLSWSCIYWVCCKYNWNPNLVPGSFLIWLFKLLAKNIVTYIGCIVSICDSS